MTTITSIKQLKYWRIQPRDKVKILGQEAPIEIHYSNWKDVFFVQIRPLMKALGYAGKNRKNLYLNALQKFNIHRKDRVYPMFMTEGRNLYFDDPKEKRFIKRILEECFKRNTPVLYNGDLYL
jgi:hypothetical protein